MTRALTQRQAELLSRLETLFLNEGFGHLTLDDIASRLHCSKSTLYALAGSKEQLAVRVVGRYFKGAAERIELYELTVMTSDVRDLADVLHRSTMQVEGAMRGLRALKDPQSTLKLCIDINRLENEADAILRRSVARLFKEEKDPITVIKWKEVYENLENASDRCEDVGNVLEGIIVKHA